MAAFAVLCSGQGRQTPNLIARASGSPGAARLLDAVRPHLPAGLREAPGDVDPDLLFLDAIAQPLICLYQLMAWETLAPSMPRPDLLAGYSLGEFNACALAGCFAPGQALDLAARRAREMDQAAAGTPSGLMAVLGLSPETAARVAGQCRGSLAIVVGPDHVVAGVGRERFEELSRAFAAAGATRVEPLPVPLASHTPFLAQASARFGEALRQTMPTPPAVPVLSGVSAEAQWDPAPIARALAAQISTTIRWDLCMETMLSRGCRVFLELGPGRDLSHMILARDPGAAARSLDEFHDISAASAWVAKELSRQE
ncbi:Polyketide biosynthesis malonyl CoA-acyl carrier protein transacylase PksC [Fundidesulfovibrio magnetotacticus]|uniref:Polyketide biosynthesis malonyl CoA-acyl carrier protein transacylase PksC n=1 Tax=Fundidesulfovibrio magnetotacticus TaxID=2730080 RepID=A0A6V8LTL0_9BACT|nr:acyltransferase domain-containing protein [Fundidesulfovibrio magnetotacticus]GFK92977.1 Polyketide biosynthesis malonyl CoA-acyl carrier protein transacylase PksC [Fundidesulfovibrio magnetotacticus]